MTGDELTGTLQSRGQEESQSYVVIDGVSLDVPDYVLDWMAKMKNPLQNGETVLYKKQQDREGGKWRLTKIRRPDKGGSKPAAGPQVDQKSGILISHYPTGCVVRMSNGDKTYALKTPFPQVDLPQKIEFTVDKNGFVQGHRFYGKADVALQENLDRLNGPADGETVSPPGGELVKAPPKEPPKVSPKESPKAQEEKTTARPTSQPAPDNIGMCTLTIGGTINLQNYENLKVEISGPAAYRREIIMYLNDTLEMLGKKEPTTGGMIDAWRKRVLGGIDE